MNYFDYVKGAIELQDLLHKWQEDIIYTAEGGKIYYAIDVDVIKMYADNRGNYSYAKIFNDDSEEDLRILVWALSDYIFNRDNVIMRPLFLICPHNIELKKMLFAIMNDATEEVRAFLKNKEIIKSIFKKYKNDEDDDALISELKQHTMDLISFLTENSVGFNSQLSLISKLLKKNVIKPIMAYSENVQGDEEWFFPELYDQTNIQHYEILKEKKIKWIKLLKKNSPRVIRKAVNIYEKNLSVDAEVLSRLEYINECMQEEKKRLVLITGDTKIKTASKQYRINEDKAFYDYYIRDPKVFYAAPDLFSKDVSKNNAEVCSLLQKQNDLIKWIEVFLSGFNKEIKINNDGDDVDSIKRLYGNIIYTNKKEIEIQIKEIKKIWGEYVRNNVLYCGLSKNNGVKKLKELISRQSYDLIIEKVYEEVVDVWYDFWKTSVKVGYWMVRDIEMSLYDSQKYNKKDLLLPLRGIPALQLTYPKAMGEVKKMCETLAHSKVIESKKIFELLEEEDPTNYTAFLVYALAFGATGRWGISCMLADISIRIADSLRSIETSTDTHEKITGNEASYLYAWSIRHNSRTKEELLKAKYLLKEARRRKYEACKNSDDIRYDCEDIGLDITYNMYGLFIEENERKNDEIDDLYQCNEKVKRIINRIDHMSQKGTVNNRNLTDIMVWRQSLTYYYLTDIIIRFKYDNQKEADCELSYKYLSKFEEIINGKKYIIKSCLNYVVYNLSQGLYSKSREKRIYSFEEVKRIYETGKIENCFIMPYDEMLFTFLRKIADNKI